MMKKLFTLLLALSVTFTLAACSGNNSVTINETASNDSHYEVPELGLTLSIPQEFFDNGGVYWGPSETLDGHPLLTLSHYYGPITDPLMDDYAEKMQNTPELVTSEYVAEFYENLYAHSRYVLWLVLIPEAEYEERIANGEDLVALAGGDYAPVEEIGINEGYVYLLSIPEMDLSNCSNEEIAEYEACKATMNSVKSNIKFTEVTVLNDGSMIEYIPAFSTKDLNGNVVTDSIFAEKDLTIINIWGTFCVPCVEEMPELGQWAKELPDNVQLIGLLNDVNSEADTEHWELAKRILDKAGADFVNLIANNDFQSVMNYVIGVPTTIFVDRYGNVVGEAVVGADVEAYKNFVEGYINE